ncbi:MAG: argininosuccinate synthase [Candidatus Omnitrophica bacterium CG1_02_44_16]|nr:MAG: argininosuccinate synthase [Candidatus Omnitrophica bacterium CG1_02_44_16]PIY82073.1 MAG: argininosuccinate synthase [Candidatus Omnitrophica bacterium CG_4_10_14_0_8_um_filter_44_12]PIZ84802.1 MAG: argininosuccinate synthase [Candidatus Omnitrophica bacterium CG_4_10_14_0_2_um_filter_44_9]
MKKVVLAYSGGLDTSCAIKWLKDKGYEVIAYIGDVGQGEDFAQVEKRALKTGAKKVYVGDLKQEFIADYIIPTLQANAAYEDKYLLATALTRPLIARHLVEVAHREKAHAIGHGCTGKGNDQVRFEVTANILDPKLEIVAPVREWEFRSREDEVDYAKRNNIPLNVTKKKVYSIDKNLWGISIECGVLEDPDHEPTKDAYQMTVAPEDAPSKPTYIVIGFDKGIPVSINGKNMEVSALIRQLHEAGGKNGVGRVDMVENRLVGIKSREIYEFPAATCLYTAHRDLESLVLDRELLHFKQSMEQKYAEIVYYGLWFSELKRALDAFIKETQKNVTGAVRLKLYKGNCIVVGRRSPKSLYKESLATYTQKDKFDQKLAEGFIRLWGLPYSVNRDS